MNIDDNVRVPCRDPQHDPDDWFIGEDSSVGAKSQEKTLEVKARCTQLCPVYHQCAQWALDEGVPYGIFGGMGGRDRKRIWKESPAYPMGRPVTFDRVMDSLVPKFQPRQTHCRLGHELKRAASGSNAQWCPVCNQERKERKRAS